MSRRTREIGIRMALGATAANVRQLVVREGLRTTIVGLAIGTLMAAGIGKLVSGLLYRVSPFDPLVLTVAIAGAVDRIGARVLPSRSSCHARCASRSAQSGVTSPMASARL